MGVRRVEGRKGGADRAVRTGSRESRVWEEGRAWTCGEGGKRRGGETESHVSAGDVRI